MLDLQYPSSLQAITSLLPLPLTHRYSLNWNPAVLIHGRLNYFPCQAKKESLNSLSKSNKTLPATPALILVMVFNILTLTPLFDKGMTSYFVWVLQSLYVNTDTQYWDTKCCCHCTTTQHPRYTDEKYSGVDWENPSLWLPFSSDSGAQMISMKQTQALQLWRGNIRPSTKAWPKSFVYTKETLARFPEAARAIQAYKKKAKCWNKLR